MGLIVLLMLMGLGRANAQTSSGVVKGRVMGADGQALPYAAIATKGATTGVATNDEGYFSMSVVAGNHVIVVTHAGYISFEKAINVTADQTLELGTIKLALADEQLSEVVVDGMITKFSKKESEKVARMPLKNLENPQVYTVVPKELLTEQIAVDFRSALLTSPGVANVTLGVGSGGTGMGMYLRGFTGANGAGAIRNGMATNFVSLSDPANLESLEIIKGPSSTLFGTTLISYGGLVNRNTKKAFARTAGEVSLSSGSDGLGRIAVDYNTALDEEKKFLFRFNVALHREKSFQDYGRNKTMMIAPTFTYHASDRLTLDVDMEYFESERNTTYINVSSATGIKNINELDWDFEKSFTSNELVSAAKVLNLLGKASYKISDVWTSETMASVSNTENNANYLFLMVNWKDSLNRRIMNIPSYFNTNQVQQNFVGTFDIGNMKNKVLVGADYTRLQTTDTRATINVFDKVSIHGNDSYLNMYKYSDALAKTAPFERKRLTQTYSAYASDVLTIADRLTLMASLRVDHFSDDIEDYEQTSLSPKFGVVYQVWKNKVSLFGNFMDGFKNVAPQLTESSPTETVDFKPEHANQLEAGVKFELIEGKLNGTLSYYDIKVKDRVRTVTGTDGNSYSVQDGTQNSKGFEADLIANPIKGMHIILGYGYNDSKYTKAEASINGKRPYAVPKQVGNFWISQKAVSGSLKGFGLGVGGNFADDHFYNSANTITVDGYTKFDATAFFENSKFRFGVKINNLTNEEYWMTDYYAEPQAVRSYIANFTMKF